MTSTLLPGASPDHRSRVSSGLSLALIAGGTLLALACGALVAVSPHIAAALVVVVLLIVAVARRPAVAAYLIVGVTPLVVGIDRGRLLPVLRPNEALVALLVAILLGGVVVQLTRRQRLVIPTLHPVEWSLIALAVTSSVVPIAWQVVRGIHPTGDDYSYALVLWKYLAVFAVVRFTVRRDREARTCIFVIEASTLVVGMIAILQALDLLGVRAFLAAWYSTLGDLGALDISRAGSTLGLPAAAADLMVITMCLAIGMWLRERTHGWWHGSVVVICVLGTFSAGEISSVLGLLLAALTIALVLRRRDIIGYTAAAALFGIVVMWPIVDRRLQGFQSASGFPESWIGRWRNLTTYFWPQLFSGSGWNTLLGVQPAARVPVASQATGYVWIESGYTWLLWGGGLPLLFAFVAFVYTSLRLTWRPGGALTNSAGVAALGASAGIILVAFLMIFDPHLTYRGSADCLLSLLAICVAAAADGRLRGTRPEPLATAAANDRTMRTEAMV